MSAGIVASGLSYGANELFVSGRKVDSSEGVLCKINCATNTIQEFKCSVPLHGVSCSPDEVCVTSADKAQIVEFKSPNIEIIVGSDEIKKRMMEM